MDNELDKTNLLITKTGEIIKHLSPAYFGLVMATGIVSIGAELLGMHLLAMSLFIINLIAFFLLWILYLVRLLFYTRFFLEDLKSHQAGMGFFTIVAGTCVVGTDRKSVV